MRLILHAGTHKTGTTSIQTCLAQNRDWLRAHGYVYPSLGPVGHNEFAHRLSRASANGIEALRTELMRASDPDSGLILSAEEFSTQLVGAKQWCFDKDDYWDRRRRYLKRLQDVLRDFDEIELFLCFRRHDAFAQSLYATNILSNQYCWSFAEFRERCSPLFDYRRQVEEFRIVFANARIIAFESLRGNLMPRFCAWTSLPELPKSLNKQKKVSPDPRLIYWLCARAPKASELCDKPFEPVTFKLMASFARSKSAASLLSDTPGSLWRSEQEWRDFLTSCTEPERGFFPPSSSHPSINLMPEEELNGLDQAFAEWRMTPRKEKTWRRFA